MFIYPNTHLEGIFKDLVRGLLRQVITKMDGTDKDTSMFSGCLVNILLY